MPRLSKTELYLRELLAIALHNELRHGGVDKAFNTDWTRLPSARRRAIRKNVEASIHSLDKRQDV